MPQPLKPGPTPSSPSAIGSAATPAFRAQLDDFRFETDFVELAERFSALSGGGFSPEISADLALEVVLNEIVERACGATGATGAAIVLWRDGEMVCRASSGHTAPDMGARLDTSSGISGECIRTHKTQHCDDVLADPRADIEASYRLGVRSVIVMPLMRGEKLLGLFELLSSLPCAFVEQDELVMEALASRTLSNLERASEPLVPRAPAKPTAETPEPTTDKEEVPRRRLRGVKFDWVTWLLGAAVVSCAILLGILVAQHLMMTRRSARAPSTVSKPSSVGNSSGVVSSSAGANIPIGAPSSSEFSAPKKPETAKGAPSSSNADTPNSAKPNSASSPGSGAVPPGGLLVSEGGKEVFRMQPGQQPAGTGNGSSGQQGSSAASTGGKRVVELSPAEAEDSVVERVEPDYPEQARDVGIQGAVVLSVKIKPDGRVEDVQVVSGPSQLVAPSVVAVKQWRFKPHAVGGRPTAMQTRVTLNFVLPH